MEYFCPAVCFAGAAGLCCDCCGVALLESIRVITLALLWSVHLVCVDNCAIWEAQRGHRCFSEETGCLHGSLCVAFCCCGVPRHCLLLWWVHTSETEELELLCCLFLYSGRQCSDCLNLTVEGRPVELCRQLRICCVSTPLIFQVDPTTGKTVFFCSKIKSVIRWMSDFRWDGCSSVHWPCGWLDHEWGSAWFIHRGHYSYDTDDSCQVM